MRRFEKPEIRNRPPNPRPARPPAGGGAKKLDPWDCCDWGGEFARGGDDCADGGKAKVDGVLRASVELQMNPATDTFAGRKRQRIELEVRVAEAPVLHGGARGLDD